MGLKKNEDGTYALDPKESVERAFGMLEAYGVSRKRAKDVANGIEVLMTRIRKSDRLEAMRFADLQAKHDALLERLRGLPEDWRRSVEIALANGVEEAEVDAWRSAADELERAMEVE